MILESYSEYLYQYLCFVLYSLIMGIFYVLYSSPAIIMSSAWPSLPATTSKYAYNVVQAILFMLKIIGQSNVTAPPKC